MKSLLVSLLLFFHLNLQAQTRYELERINFYPKVKAYAKLEYFYQTLFITTPNNTLNSSEVRNYKNTFTTTYAYKLDWLFLGTTVSYEVATENAANYGIPSNERFSSQGFKEPAFFFKTRLRDQHNDKGNIDLYLSYSDSYGSREIGKSSANRLNGGNILTSRITHGIHEYEWEFCNNLEYSFLGKGEEQNDFTNIKHYLGSYNIISYFFLAQYQVNSWLFLNSGIGIEYRTVQEISDQLGEKREIQEGTGSLFRVGIKRPLSEWSLAEFSYELRRSSYFVNGISTFDGDSSQNSFLLSFIQGF
ncbi:MAG: hypothetical protein NDI69_11130 [Bacteriovoracaceae bacterium]|nr:hypothetical protein [Bacteriovoracaceae bacterium]